MHLTAANLPYFLINGGLLSPDAIVESDLAILDVSRRNRNFKVIRKSGSGLFIKQMREGHPDAMYTLRREAACYERARDDPTLGPLMPRLMSADRGRFPRCSRTHWLSPLPRCCLVERALLLARLGDGGSCRSMDDGVSCAGIESL